MLESAGGGAPVAVHLDKELQEDFLLEEFLDIFACLHPYSLKRRTGFADDDALLAVSFAIYNSGDTDEIIGRS